MISPRSSFRKGFTRATHVSLAMRSIKFIAILAVTIFFGLIVLVRVPDRRAGMTLVLFRTNLSPGRSKCTKSLTIKSSIVLSVATSSRADTLGILGLSAIKSVGSSKAKSSSFIYLTQPLVAAF